MGSSSYSSSVYHDRAKSRAATGTPTFAHTANVASGKVAAAVHDRLNPLNVKMRESRDSVDHPTSLAIGVIFDVTGSMGSVPIALQKKLTGLMALLIQKGFAAHPQLLFGAIGDANSDQAPLQIGQFESGNEMEDDLSLVYIEGNGGGQQRETYELAHYFFARHTSIDCFEKRGQKGYLFTIGDENFYPVIRRDQVKELTGDSLQADLNTVEVIKELEKRYHVFHIIAEQGGYPHDAGIEASWKSLLGERVLKLEDTEAVAELIATTIGLTEGTVDLEDAATAMKDLGTDHRLVDSVTTSLATLAQSAAMTAKSGTASGVDSSSVSVERV